MRQCVLALCLISQPLVKDAIVNAPQTSISEGERSSAYMVIGSECCDVMIRFKFGACGLAYVCVAGEIAMETEMIGLDWVSIIFLPLRIKLIEMSTLSCRCKRYSQIFVSVVLAWNKRSVRYHYTR